MNRCIKAFREEHTFTQSILKARCDIGGHILQRRNACITILFELHEATGGNVSCGYLLVDRLSESPVQVPESTLLMKMPYQSQPQTSVPIFLLKESLYWENLTRLTPGFMALS